MLGSFTQNRFDFALKLIGQDCKELLPDQKNEVVSFVEREIYKALFGDNVFHDQNNYLLFLSGCISDSEVYPLQLDVYSKFGRNSDFSTIFDHQAILHNRRISDAKRYIKEGTVATLTKHVEENNGFNNTKILEICLKILENEQRIKEV